MNDMDTLRRMYAIVFSGADEALTLLEAGNVPDAKACLMLALGVAEEMYIAGDGGEAALDTPGES